MIAIALAVSEILKFHSFYLEKYVKVISCKSWSGFISWQVYNSTKVVLCVTIVRICHTLAKIKNGKMTFVYKDLHDIDLLLESKKIFFISLKW